MVMVVNNIFVPNLNGCTLVWSFQSTSYQMLQTTFYDHRKSVHVIAIMNYYVTFWNQSYRSHFLRWPLAYVTTGQQDTFTPTDDDTSNGRGKMTPTKSKVVFSRFEHL